MPIDKVISHVVLGKHPPMLWYEDGGHAVVGTHDGGLAIHSPGLNPHLDSSDNPAEECSRYSARPGYFRVGPGHVHQIKMHDGALYAEVNGAIPRGLAYLKIGTLPRTDNGEVCAESQENARRLIESSRAIFESKV